MYRKVDTDHMYAQLEFQVREYLNGYMSYEALLGYIVALFNNSLLTINEMAMLLDAIEKDREVKF